MFVLPMKERYINMADYRVGDLQTKRHLLDNRASVILVTEYLANTIFYQA